MFFGNETLISDFDDLNLGYLCIMCINEICHHAKYEYWILKRLEIVNIKFFKKLFAEVWPWQKTLTLLHDLNREICECISIYCITQCKTRKYTILVQDHCNQDINQSLLFTKWFICETCEYKIHCNYTSCNHHHSFSIVYFLQ